MNECNSIDRHPNRTSPPVMSIAQIYKDTDARMRPHGERKKESEPKNRKEKKQTDKRNEHKKRVFVRIFLQ